MEWPQGTLFFQLLYVNTITPSVLEIIKINIFFRPEEAMLETGESLS